MTVLIPYTNWFTVQLWMEHNYITSSDYTHVHIGDRVAVTFAQVGVYARFYRAWQHIILADNDF